MRFRSPTKDTVHIALTNGHIAQVGPQYSELSPMFHREAVALGCIPEGTATPDAQAGVPTIDRDGEIKKAIDAMLDGNDAGDFTGDGKPDTRGISKRVGFTVLRDERDRIWMTYEQVK